MTQPIFQYQEEGARIIAGYERFGLHDEMGVGKTATTIRAIDINEHKRGIIVAPAFLLEHWRKEFRKFSTRDHRLAKARNVNDYMAWHRGVYNIMVCSYEHASKWAQRIKESGDILDFIAIDEADYLKNTGAQRTKKILGQHYDGKNGLLQWCCQGWHITGTPMRNDPLDIYTFLRFARAVEMSENQFIKTFFHQVRTKYGTRQHIRPEMLTTLQALISNNSIRRTKDQVGIQIPPIFLTETVVDGDIDKVMKLLKEHPGLDRAIEIALEQGGLSFLDAPHIETLRRLIGEAKAIPYAEMLLEEIQSSGEKRVVYGIHVDALRNVYNYLTTHSNMKVVLVQGGTREVDDIEAIRSFQEDEETMVFLGNIQKASRGATLTASCEVDLLESDWSPAGNAQALMRVHRIGQTRKVRGRFITLARSFDEVVNKIVAIKTASIAKIEGFAMSATPYVLDDYAQFV